MTNETEARDIIEERLLKLEAKMVRVEEWMLLTVAHNRAFLTQDHSSSNLRYRAEIVDALDAIVKLVKSSVTLREFTSDLMKQVVVDLQTPLKERW